EVPKTTYEAVSDSVPSDPAAPVFDKTGTSVTAGVKRFDRVMEGLGLGTQPKSNVQSSVTAVDTQLSNYAPAEVTKVETTDTKEHTADTNTSSPVPTGGGGSSTG